MLSLYQSKPFFFLIGTSGFKFIILKLFWLLFVTIP